VASAEVVAEPVLRRGVCGVAAGGIVTVVGAGDADVAGGVASAADGAWLVWWALAGTGLDHRRVIGR